MKQYTTSHSTSQMYLTCQEVWEVYLLTLQQHETLQHYSLITYSASFTQCINFKVAVG